jgi:hypothetical protein
MKKQTRMGQIIKFGIQEAIQQKGKPFEMKEDTTMTTYRNVMKYSAIIGLVGLAYYSIQTNSTMTIPMALVHALAIYAIIFNKERQ